jgi:TonB family protein
LPAASTTVASANAGDTPPTAPPEATPTPAATRPAGGPMHLEDVDTRPKRVSCGAPVWPREALEARVSGTVVAKCVVTEGGALSGCRIVKGVPYMDGAVLASLATCKYTPALAQGRPVAVDIPITMKLTPP